MYMYIYECMCLCIFFKISTVYLWRSPRNTFILSPADFVISPVGNLLLGLTPKNVWKFKIFPGESSSPHRGTDTGCHNSFQVNVSPTHPTFWKFLDIVLREERIFRVRMLQDQAGHTPKPQRRRSADCNARILRIVDYYQNRQVTDYLRHIVHNLSL